MAKNLFESAVSTKAAPKAKGKSSKAFENIAGIEDLAVLVSLEKTIAALKAETEGRVKARMLELFVEKGMERGLRPENFIGKEHIGSASCELRKRSSASGLSVAEQTILAGAKVSVETVSDVPETFIINPAYKDDMDLLGRVSTALQKVKDLPVDFLMHQEATTKIVTTEESLNEVFNQGTNDASAVTEILKVVGVLAVKPKLEEVDFDKLIERLKAIKDGKTDAAREAFADSLKASVAS